MIFAIGAGAAAVLLCLFFVFRKGAEKKAPAPENKPRKRSAPLPEVQTEAADSVVQTPAPPLELPESLSKLVLLRAGDLDENVAKGISDICAAVAEPHPVQRQLATELDSPEALMDAVSSDPGLTAGILKTVNSAAFSLASPITSVQHAITYLGMGMVKSLVAQTAMGASTEEGTAEQQAALSNIWRAAGTASAVAQLIGQQLAVERPSVLATRALFSNLGDVALISGYEGAAQWYTPNSSVLARIDFQQESTGANSALIGARLAAQWELPDDICKAIEHGLEPLTASSMHGLSAEDKQTNLLVYLSSRIGDRVSYQGLSDLGDLEFGASEEEDLFFLPSLLREAGMERALAVMGDIAFRRKLTRLFATFGA